MAFPPLPPTLHPVLVHFAIGLVPAAAAFATIAAWRDREWAARAALWTLAAAALFSALAVVAGFRDYLAVRDELTGVAYDTLEWHERLGIVTGAFIVGTALVAAWKRRAVLAGEGSWRWALAVALLVAFALVGITGWYGGSLVFDHGVAVREAAGP